jgi:membrane protein DedA with SNARE-associated domain
VRRTEGLFARHQRVALAVSKFVPGLKTVAPLLAGMRRMAPLEFALYDGIGSLLWLGAFVALGWVFKGQAARVAIAAARIGGFVALAAGVGFAAWLGWKVLARWRSDGGAAVLGLRPALATEEAAAA